MAVGGKGQTGPAGREGSCLEVRAVVVVPVHDGPLAAGPGQHGDHLPPGQVRVELRGEDVYSRGRQGLRGRGSGQGLTTWGLTTAVCGRPAPRDRGPQGGEAELLPGPFAFPGLVFLPIG